MRAHRSTTRTSWRQHGEATDSHSLIESSRRELEKGRELLFREDNIKKAICHFQKGVQLLASAEEDEADEEEELFVGLHGSLAHCHLERGELFEACLWADTAVENRHRQVGRRTVERLVVCVT